MGGFKSFGSLVMKGLSFLVVFQNLLLGMQSIDIVLQLDHFLADMIAFPNYYHAKK